MLKRSEMILLVLSSILAHVDCSTDFLWKNKHFSPQDRAAALIAEMTLQEKFVMLHGDYNDSPIGDVYYVGFVPGNKRLGIPELRLNDGPQGYRDDLNPKTTTAWPAALTISNTWDLELFKRWGIAMADEFYQKGANVLLGPGVNLARVPTNGRNFEYISGEDPYLGYRLVQPLVRGIQSRGVIANAKHWVENNQETDRLEVSEVVDERTRHELYYQPFYGAVEAGVGSFMCSYNKVNGLWSCENPETLKQDLKGHLGFNGWVMSDWWATHSVSINEGLDQEMPVAWQFSPDNLLEKIHNGALEVGKIDESLSRIFVPMFQFGLFDNENPNKPTNDVTSEAHSRLAREISADSHVLLKNDDNLLPLPRAATEEKQFKIALIGQHVRSPIIGGGGSGSVIPKELVTPLAGVLSALNIADAVPVKADCSSEFILANTSIDQDCWPSLPASSVEECAQLCESAATCRYYSYWVQNYPWCTLYPSNYKQYSDEGTADVVVGRCVKEEPAPTWQCNADHVCVATADGSDIDVATRLAKEADVAVVLIASFAKEGVDRQSLSFEANSDGTCQLAAPAQDALVTLVAAAGARTVVAAAAPGAMLTPWRNQVQAILHGFMPGQEYGHALADILFGRVNPSAKLTVTLPNEENEVGFKPDAYPGINLEGTYTEKMKIGYRWYTSYKVKPAFPFGHGLSYTTFAYSALNTTQISPASGAPSQPRDAAAAPAAAPPTAVVTVIASVTNSGTVPGREVAQLYVTFPTAANTPPLQLKGFAKTALLAPGETAQVAFPLRQRDLSVWDELAHGWAAVKGEFKFMVGSSSSDARLHGRFVA